MHLRLKVKAFKLTFYNLNIFVWFRYMFLRYDSAKIEHKRVYFPEDDVLIFDVETMVKHNNIPIMAVAASSEAW